MTIITTAVVDVGIRRNWTVNPNDLISPIAEIIYHGQNAIPSKLSTDQNLFTLELQIPDNFAYRMVDLHLQLAGTQGVVMLDFAGGASFEFNNAGVTERVGQVIVPRAVVDGVGLLEGGGYIKIPGVTNDTVEHFILDQAYDEAFVVTSAGQLFLRLNDSSTDATTATSLIHHCRMLQYTIEQFNHAPMHSPLPVINP